LSQDFVDFCEILVVVIAGRKMLAYSVRQLGDVAIKNALTFGLSLYFKDNQ
jgi:hypothetical protein